MNKYTEDLRQKYIKKSGHLPPCIVELEKNQELLQTLLIEQWLEGYKTAKKKYKNKG